MPLDIPVLVQSLGHDMFRIGMDQNTVFRPSIDLIIYLDGNITSRRSDDPSLHISDFLNPWWLGDVHPSKPSTIFSAGTVRAALDHYRKQLESDTITAPALSIDLTTELNKPCYTWHDSAYADTALDCTRCRLYRAVPLGTMDTIRDYRNMVHGLEVASEGKRDVAMRRASIFNELYEAALQKECRMDAESKPRKKVPQQVIPKGPIEVLKSEIKSLIMMCTNDPSRKWTWGVDLTEADLDRLVRGADRYMPNEYHSGYDTDLESVALASVTTYSINASKLEDPDTFDLHFEELSPDFPSSPPDHKHPSKFSFTMINSSGRSIDSFSSDSVYRAFRARSTAVRLKRKLVLQQEVDEPVADSSSDSERTHSRIQQLSLVPRRPWLGPPISNFVSQPVTGMPSANQ